MDFVSFILFTVTLIVAIVLWKGIKIVPQQMAFVVERLGRFDRVLQPGLNLLNPLLDKVAYRHSLKEYASDVPEQTTITRDNVTLAIDGILYIRIIDPQHASYGVSDPLYAVTQLAQTTMRSEIGKLALDECFEERERLNANIVATINQAAQTWGIQCMRYEIKNISPPKSVLQAMEMQMSAERKKRADILQSEGGKQSQINIAEANKAQVVLQSEASKIDQINRAQGEAESIRLVAEATAQGIRLVANAIGDQGGQDAVALRVAEKYIDAFGKLAKESNTMILPANAADTGSMVAQALAVFQQVRATEPNSLPQEGPWKRS